MPQCSWASRQPTRAGREVAPRIRANRGDEPDEVAIPRDLDGPSPKPRVAKWVRGSPAAPSVALGAVLNGLGKKELHDLGSRLAAERRDVSGRPNSGEEAVVSIVGEDVIIVSNRTRF